MCYVLCITYYVLCVPCLAANDFVLRPAKLELEMSPGQALLRTLYISNNLGSRANFKVTVIDIEGALDASQPAVLLEEGQSGFYSLKDYLIPQMGEFSLENGQTIALPVQVNLPNNIEPGGLYGAVLITALPPAENGAGQVAVLGRLGALFFVKVKGEVLEKGGLDNFSQNRTELEGKQAVIFSILFENQGNVHLNPYGGIEIKNIFGKKIAELALAPFYVLPNSLRQRQVAWQNLPKFGYYKAVLLLNRGYDNIIDKAEINFWLASKQALIAGLIIILIFIGLTIIVIARRKNVTRNT